MGQEYLVARMDDRYRTLGSKNCSYCRFFTSPNRPYILGNDYNDCEILGAIPPDIWNNEKKCPKFEASKNDQDNPGDKA